MVVTNYAKERVALSIGSDLSNNHISAVAVGSGSGAALPTNTTLVAETHRNLLTGSPDFTTTRKVTFTADFNSVELSGLSLSEFGFFQSGAAATGSVWWREGIGSVVFDGSNELQIEGTIEVL